MNLRFLNAHLTCLRWCWWRSLGNRSLLRWLLGNNYFLFSYLQLLDNRLRSSFPGSYRLNITSVCRCFDLKNK